MEKGEQQFILGVPQRIGEQKKFSSKKRNWSLIILGVSVFVLIVWGLMPNISKIIFQNMPKVISSSLYEKELKKAKWYASRPGFANMMEDHLIKAKWDAREKGVDISEKVKEIYASGSRFAVESALSRALYGHMDSAGHDLVRYKRFCSKAGIQPDDEKIAEVKMIIQRN